MRAVLYDQFGEPPVVCDVPPPDCPPHGAIIEVRATGVCRSDWHAWMGHDADVVLPHVPGHEFAGVIAQVGALVEGWRVGERVTAPFVGACGTCDVCAEGLQNVCPNQTQPGFTHWGSFAELVLVDHAAVNLVGLPAEVDFVTAAGLGCRFATAYRAIVDLGAPAVGQWVAVFGCGGVGLSAVMIAARRGVRVIAVDVAPDALALASAFGAEVTLEARAGEVPARIREITAGGVHVSVDALGRAATFADALASLRRRGRHVQVGLLLAEDANPVVDMGAVIARELEIVGSHGMAAHSYPRMLAEIADGTLAPDRLVSRTIDLAEAPAALMALDRAEQAGTTVIVIG